MMTDGAQLIRRAIAAHPSQRREATPPKAATPAPPATPQPAPKPAAPRTRFAHLAGHDHSGVRAVCARVLRPKPEPEQPIADLVAGVLRHTSSAPGRRR